jgi:hypothetical protein
MKTGRSLTEVATELERQRSTRRDYLAQTTALTMMTEAQPTDAGADGRVQIAGLNGAPLAVRPYAHGQIAEQTGIPKRYYDRMLAEAPSLLAENVNTWWRANPERRMVRTLDTRVRALLSDRYRPLDNFDLAEAVLPVLVDRGCEIVSTELTESRLYIKAVLPSLQTEVKGSRQRGDVVEAGLAVSNSEIGAGRLRVEPMIYRLVCLNGAIASDSGLRRYHVGKRAEEFEGIREMLSTEAREADDRAFWLAVRDVVKGAFERDVFERIVARMSEAAQTPITSTDLTSVVEVASERLGIDEGRRGGVLKHLIEGGDLSRWGLANAITRLSQDVEDYDEATDLERAGGQVIELKPTEWAAITKAAA